MITFYLSDEFQNQLRHELRLCILKQHNPLRFPISSAISLYVDLYTNRSISLLGIAKNVLDACNSIVYTDDSHVVSLIVKKHPTNKDVDSIGIRILSGRELHRFEVDKSAIISSTVLSLDVETIVEDRYLPNPPSMEYVDIVDGNQDYDSRLHAAISDAYSMQTAGGEIIISLTIVTSEPKVDIDNVAQNFLLNMVGVVYADVTQIVGLHLRIKKDADSLGECIIKVKDIA